MSKASRAILIALLLIAAGFNSVSFYLYATIGEKLTFPALMAALALALPSLIVIAWLLIRPGVRPAGIAAGLGLTMGFAALMLGSLLFLGAWNPGDGERALKALVFLVAPHALLAVGAIIVTLREYGRYSVTDLAIGLVIAIFLDAASAFAAGVTSTAIDIANTFNWAAKHDDLRRALIRVQGCAFRFAEQNPQAGYPDKLDQIGASGTTCLDGDEKLLADAHIRYAPEYTPPGEPIRAFSVHGHLQSRDRTEIWGSADTSGLVQTVSSGFDTTRVPMGVDDVLYRMGLMRNCALYARHMGRTEPIPATIGALYQVSQGYGRVATLGCYSFDREHADSNAMTVEGHRISFRPAGGGFVLEARPVEYGVSAVNSYVLRDTGGVYLTHANRAATSSDPVIPACTYPDSSELTLQPPRCVRLARPRIDVAIGFKHPDAIVNGRFTISARDPGDSSRAPVTPNSWALLCPATDSALRYMAFPPLQHQKDHLCDTYRWPVGKPYLVMLIVRDSTGAFGWRTDTIEVRADSTAPARP